MARKSAAQFKTAKTERINEIMRKQQLADLPPIEETFDNAKQAFINTLETSVVLAKRVDNLLNIRDYALKFWGDKVDEHYILSKEKVGYYKELQAKSVEAYEKLLEATKEFELGEFMKDEMKDYYEDIIPKVDDIVTEQDLVVAGLVFLTVKPYGEKMTALHHTIQDEVAQRKALEKEI